MKGAYMRKHLIVLAAFVVALTGVVLLVTASNADAHTPNPVACDIARDAAKPGEKYRAQQLCIRAQRVHTKKHIAEARIAAATRACLAVRGSNMGVRLCSAIATVKPAWANSWALHRLLWHESSWSTNAVNEGSGACGAFQRLPCPWGYYGGTTAPGDDRVYSTALQQARNGLGNIQSRYRTPDAAYGHWVSYGWY